MSVCGTGLFAPARFGWMTTVRNKMVSGTLDWACPATVYRHNAIRTTGVWFTNFEFRKNMVKHLSETSIPEGASEM
jgi:hypothetical protein